ncbi:MAG: exodeoxyribonuclease VII large subunit [Anaerolineae bacterium]|nr:exodeoxyribonuclease VII large subunit [Anaerolineae bacterium]
MWDQLNLFSESSRPLSVSEVTNRIRGAIEQEPVLQDLWIEGEVSNFSRASSGHIYLTLKDAGSQIGAVIWRSQAQVLSYVPSTGDQVQAHGRIGVYEQGGRYQFYIDRIRPAGQGSLYQEYERLKAQLQAEGLFDEARKRPLPAFPTTIGVVTSPTAAALRDVLNVLGRRYPIVRVLLSPTLVQGDAAPPQIVAALDRLNARDDVDVILLVRGGGSLEDLWAFNDERVARAVASSRLPVVSGVGHETDFSLADFVADRRASTPSAAAEVATPELGELLAGLSQAQSRLERAMDAQLTKRRERLWVLQQALRHLSPMARIENGRQRVDDLTQRLDAAMAHRLEMARERLLGLRGKLGALSPDAVLTRGYAIVRARDTGDILTSSRQATAGLPLWLQFRDGEVAAHVDEKPG